MLAVSEHLSNCSSCRREEAFYRETARATKELPCLALSGDFNARLLDRIARERFTETRTKAYLPKAAPGILRRTLVPALATTCVAVFAVFMALGPHNDSSPLRMTQNANSLDDSYLTVQPQSNPNMTVNLEKDWSLHNQLAHAERISRISDRVARTGRLQNPYGLAEMASTTSQPMPYVTDHHRVRSVVRIYVTPQSTSQREDSRAY